MGTGDKAEPWFEVHWPQEQSTKSVFAKPIGQRVVAGSLFDEKR